MSTMYNQRNIILVHTRKTCIYLADRTHTNIIAQCSVAKYAAYAGHKTDNHFFYWNHPCSEFPRTLLPEEAVWYPWHLTEYTARLSHCDLTEAWRLTAFSAHTWKKKPDYPKPTPKNTFIYPYLIAFYTSLTLLQVWGNGHGSVKLWARATSYSTRWARVANAMHDFALDYETWLHSCSGNSNDVGTSTLCRSLYKDSCHLVVGCSLLLFAINCSFATLGGTSWGHKI